MSDADKLLAPYVTNLDRPIFALRNLPEEVVAVLFAYYSRSAGSLRDNLAKLIREGDLALTRSSAEAEADDDWLANAQEKARAFHEKWVVGYGHASVAEHAMVHLAVEDVSIVATKEIEDNRLASYTEKSTRYVPFDEDRYVREPGIAASPDADLYDATCRHLLGTYARLLPTVQQQVAERFEKPDDWTDRRYESVCQSKACDLLRYLLPTATRTNLGLTINARALEHLLTKLYSSPLPEMQNLAAALRREAEAIVPTLIKYAGPNEYRMGVQRRTAALAEMFVPPDVEQAGERINDAWLLSAPDDPLTDLTSAILYEASHGPFDALRAELAAWPAAVKQRMVDAYLEGRGRFDEPLRALEHLVYRFEILVDYGAFRDIQRHRMATQTTQVLTTRNGYETPPELVEMGHGGVYREAIERSAAAHAQLAERHGEAAAQYVLPLAWRKRVLFTWNLREMHHFISLRSGRQGHPSYRRIAQACWHELNRIHPGLAQGIRVDLEEYELARA